MANYNPIPSIDRVRTEAQERLDKPDFDATIALADESIQRQIGALLGFGSGVTAPPAVDVSKVTPVSQRIYLGAFQYYISVPTWTDDSITFKGWRGVFVTFDPTSGSQDNVIDIAGPYSTAVTGGTPTAVDAMPGIYAQPQLLDTDTDARRKWVGTADMAVTMTTRSRIRTVFKLSTAAPEHASNLGWALLGQIRWSGTTPDIFWRPWLDTLSAEAHSLDAPSGTTGLDSFVSARSSTFPIARRLGDGQLLGPGNAFDGSGGQRDLGLIQILTIMRKRFADLIYGTIQSESNWISGLMPSSIKALEASLAPLLSWKAAFDSIMGGWPYWVKNQVNFGIQVNYSSVAHTYTVDPSSVLPQGWAVPTCTRVDYGGVGGYYCKMEFSPALSVYWVLQSAIAASVDLTADGGTAVAPDLHSFACRRKNAGTVYVTQSSGTGALSDGSFFIFFTFRPA